MVNSRSQEIAYLSVSLTLHVHVPESWTVRSKTVTAQCEWSGPETAAGATFGLSASEGRCEKGQLCTKYFLEQKELAPHYKSEKVG